MFTGYDVKLLESHPCVHYVNEHSLVLTHEFRVRLFREWRLERNEQSIEKLLRQNGLGRNEVGVDYHTTLANDFSYKGFPEPTEDEFIRMKGFYKEQNPLILSGIFQRDEKSHEISLKSDFLRYLISCYPNESIEICFKMGSLDPVDIGNKTLSKIENIVKAQKNKTVSLHKASQKTTSAIHPYIEKTTCFGLTLKDEFYNENRLLLPLGVDKILDICEIDPSQITEQARSMIETKLSLSPCGKKRLNIVTAQTDRILKNRVIAMDSLVIQQFRSIGERFRDLNIDGKREVCQWIRELPKDPVGYYTKKKILYLTGISKTVYHMILTDPNYGNSAKRKAIKDDEDIKTIIFVLEYMGYKKGIRQINMLMPRITEKYLSINRIRTLLKKYDIKTPFMKPRNNRKAAKELVERNRRSNLLMRGFRLFKPNEVRLTDVTYLSYGNDKRAYGSASIDPVTGVLVCFIVSEHNDLKLAMDTLEAMDAHPAKTGAILHSDQGMLYMTDDFQSAVKALDMQQSMSRRGNCWDNAPQESFFGHFKRECNYKNCTDIEELRTVIDDYGLYYNKLRGLWDREKMTPLEYESYLNAMTEEEWEAHLQAELERYEEMKESAARKVIQRSTEEKAKREEALWEKSI